MLLTDADMQDHIDHILDHFDFERVATAMDALGWRWRGHSITTPMLRQEARTLLRHVASLATTQSAYGGLVARYHADSDGSYLSLTFEVESWDSLDAAE